MFARYVLLADKDMGAGAGWDIPEEELDPSVLRQEIMDDFDAAAAMAERTYKREVREQKPQAKTELLRYKKLMLGLKVEWGTCPLKWWRANADKFPWCAKLARRDLAVFGSQAAVERIFSKAGYLCSNRRAKMLPSTLKRLVFLNMNYKHIK